MKVGKWKKRFSVLSCTIVAASSLISYAISFTKDHKTPPKDSVTSFHEKIESITEAADWKEVKNGKADAITEAIRNASEEFAKQEDLGEFQKASLIRVVDGDTIVVEMDGDEYSVRLIGIDTPESVASEEYLKRTGKENTKEGEDASQYTKDLLSNVAEVYLQKDVSNTDRYGRLLRYVWLEIPDDKADLSEISTKMLNGILAKSHIAEVKQYAPNTEYNEQFNEIYEMEE